MTTKTRSILAVSFGALALACADATTAPTRTLVSNTPSPTVTQEVYLFPINGGPGFPAGILQGRVHLCKTANESGTFSFTVTTNGTGTLPEGANPSYTIPAGGGTVCKIVYVSNKPRHLTDQVVITEGADPTADWDLTAINTVRYLAQGPFLAGLYPAETFLDAEDFAGRKSTVYINLDMSRKVTFENTFTSPPEDPSGCTYTKGWYQNKNGAPTVIAVDGRTKSEAQTIFAATPGKLKGVTLSGTSNTNLLLNVYQQLLAALNNLGGDAHAMDGPPAVDAAITLALSGTGGTGLNITTTLTQQQLGDIATALGNFNEGLYQGWPHCAD